MNKASFGLNGEILDRVGKFINQSLRPADLRGGGNFLIISPTSLAEKIENKVKEAFKQKSRGGLKVTTSTTRVSRGEVEEFGEVWNEARKSIREKKTSRISLPEAVEGG